MGKGTIIKWTDWEIAILKEKYPHTPGKHMRRFLPSRTLSAIRSKASLLKVHRLRTKATVWTKAELETLIHYYPMMAAKHLLPKLPGKTLQSIYSKAASLCLKAYDNSRIDRYIRENIATSSIYRISKQLGCYCSGIRYRAQIMGLI